MRSSLTTKEGALKRAAKLLGEFQYSLQQARFQSRKVTIDKEKDDINGTGASTSTSRGGKKVVELISSTEEMESSLQRLSEVLQLSSLSEHKV